METWLDYLFRRRDIPGRKITLSDPPRQSYRVIQDVSTYSSQENLFARPGPRELE